MHRIIRVNFLHRLGFSAGPQSAWTLLQLLLLSPPLVFEYPVLPPIPTSRETPRVPAPLVLPAPSPPAQTSTQGSTFRGTGVTGGGQGGGRGAGSGAPPQSDVQPVRCIPPGIQPMPAHHSHRHHHHHSHLYKVDPHAKDLMLPQQSRPQHQPAPAVAPEPRAEPARMAAARAVGGRGAAPATQARGPKEKPARGAGGARP